MSAGQKRYYIFKILFMETELIKYFAYTASSIIIVWLLKLWLKKNKKERKKQKKLEN